MKKQILNLGTALNKAVQKEINGGGPVEGPNCRCFCYVGGEERSNSCHALCPDGSIPGVESGDSSCWTGAGSQY